MIIYTKRITAALIPLALSLSISAELFEIDPTQLCIDQAKKEGIIYFPPFKQIRRYVGDFGPIVSALFKDQKHTAAVSPTSPWAQHNITKYLSSSAPLRILEVGAGSGTITGEIIPLLNAMSKLDVVEYSPYLYADLMKNLGNKQSDAIHFYNAGIESWQPDHTVDGYYDIIISTIPITQLPFQTMENILQSYAKMLKPGGILIYVTLCGARTLTLWSKSIRRFMTESINKIVKVDEASRKALETEIADYKKILQALQDWQSNHFNLIANEVVFLNIPPMYVISLRKK